MKEIVVMLHNVRSVHNVGSIFRTADAAGVSKLYLTGYTPAPRDRFGRVRDDVAKVALGAEKFIPWEHARSPRKIIRRLKHHGWMIVGVEQDSRARDYRRFRAKRRTLFIFGNEVRGIPRSLCDACDVLIEIPMRGRKESLNISVAVGIILFS